MAVVAFNITGNRPTSCSGDRGGKYLLITIVVLFSFHITSVCGQGSDLFFEHINYEKNFAPSMISSIFQDEKGFIWLGTENGLLRYDGYNFLKYTRDRNIAGSISNNHINVIYEDSDTNLWIGTSNGINYFDKDRKIFSPIDILPIKGGRNYISSIIEDGDKRIWIGTFGGVKQLDKERHLLLNNNSNAELFNSMRVLSLFYDDRFGVFAGTSNGIHAFDPNTGQTKDLPDIFNKNKLFLLSKIWKIARDDDGDLWFATKSNGVFLYSRKQNQLINYREDFKSHTAIASNWVYDILPVDKNTIWFATIDGLSVLKKDVGEFTNYRHNAFNNYSLSDNEIKSFLKDRNGSIWVGTSAGGLNFFNHTNYNFIKIGETIEPNFGLTNPIVNALLKESEETLWVGTNGGGLNFLDFKNKKISAYKINDFGITKSSNMINVLAGQDEENLLCGTVNGLYQFNKNTKRFKRILLSKNDSTGQFPITGLLVDDKKIWVATEGDGLKILSEENIIEIFKSGEGAQAISDNFITDIADTENILWIATQDGLNLLDKKLNVITSIYRRGGKNTLSNNNLTTLFIDSKGRLWIGTDYGGLNFFDEKSQKFFVLNKSNGLTDNSIKSITEDDEGNIWVSSDDLLFKIKFINFILPFHANDLEITSYSSNDGLSLGQFSRNCSIKLNNNKLVFGASKGLAIFNAAGIIKSPNTSDIVFTRLKIHNKEVNVSDKDSPLKRDISRTSQITLNHTQGYLEIEFSAMNFVNPENNRYAFKLESFSREDEWHILGRQNSVNLPDLSPGNYVFSVKTSNEDNVWNDRVKTIKIIIMPPWWKSWWAYILYFMSLLATSLIIVRFIHTRVQLKRALFIEHVEKERQQELYKMKLDFFTNVSHEIRTPLSLMVAPIEDLLDLVEKNSKIEERLKTIKNNSDRLLKLVNELLDFRKAESGKLKIYCEKQDIVSFCFEVYESFKGIAVEKNIEYKFAIDSSFIPVYFDRYQMEKVLYNLLSNAFKFTNKYGKIVVSVEGSNKNEGWINIKIKDNGVGIPEHNKKNIFQRFFQIEDRMINNTGTGVGLALSKSIIELHKGEIGLVDENDSWSTTVFQISLRLGTDHLAKAQIVEKDSSVDELFIDSDAVLISNDVLDNLPSNPRGSDSAKKTILIVEDNDEFRRFVSDVLSDDYHILEFSNGKDAVQYLAHEIPDLVISDVMMPEMDGLELCEYIKTNESTNHIPVILLTAKSSTESKIEGLSTGADSYIAKPFSLKVLKLNIINLLSSKEIQRHKYSGNFIIDSDLKKLTTPEELFIRKLMEVIESNLENPDFSVSELVREIGMSRTILYKKVNTLTNHSVATLIKYVRLKKAADILANTSYPVSDVAFMVGFNDRKHFSREFKKVYKLSPTDYKNANLSVQ